MPVGRMNRPADVPRPPIDRMNRASMATAGGAALARLIGPVIDFFNAYRPALGYQVMLGACFLYFVAGSLLLLKVKERP